MPNESFYQTDEWKRLRRATLERDRWKCTTPGCRRPAKIVDHIVSRRKGGANTLSNLRSLCRACDNQIKESASGERRGGGKIRAAIGPDGWPVVGN